jgi:hypothetical protein
MLTGTQDHPVDGVLVEPQESSCGSDTDPLRRVVDDLLDRFSWHMQPKQRTGPGGCKTLAAGTAVEQLAVIVLAILTAKADVAMPSQAVILALFVGAKALFKLVHRLPPSII